MLVGIIISLIINFLFAIYVIQQGKKYKSGNRTIIKLLLYNLTQTLFCLFLFRSTYGLTETMVTVCVSLCMILQILSFGAVKIIFDSMMDKISIEEEYEFLLRKEEQDQTYFAMMKEHEEHVARIRHDFINQVAVASSMIQSKENNEVGQKLLDELREEIESTRTAVFCENKMVNIVVDVIQKKYIEQNRKLDVNIVLPSPLLLDEMKLCSIIQAMLDEMLSVVQLNDGNKGTVYFQVKKTDKELLFMAKCNKKGIENKKKYDKIVRSYQKYFERILEPFKSGVYNREKEEYLERIISLREEGLVE